jgi:hypothetical protein
MEFTIQHNEKSYTDKEIRKVLDIYNNNKEHMRKYTSKRHENYRQDLTSDDPEKKKKAEAYREYMKVNSSKHYHDGYKKVSHERYENNKEMMKARQKYHYYKKHNRLEKFLKPDDFIESKELLKTDDSRSRSAKLKYPELFL